MIVEYIRYAVPAEHSTQLVGAYREASASLRASPHCLAFELAQCTEDEGAFVLRITWDSLEGHLEGFRKSPEFQSFFHAIGPFLKNIEEMRHYQVTEVSWSREP